MRSPCGSSRSGRASFARATASSSAVRCSHSRKSFRSEGENTKLPSRTCMFRSIALGGCWSYGREPLGKVPLLQPVGEPRCQGSESLLGPHFCRQSLRCGLQGNRLCKQEVNRFTIHGSN